ncbi:Carboxylic ester hydrolase [Mycena sanguinolenta]|uniref:Carboxylic ester hydrolase n=1 Tax=Mycena sanguinolenta TaxID=230812 RepID=A0A8H7DJV7_9AGAR|nr:Carboxylic ester hydrolase [Mycena sanguinolenta]
MLPLALVLFCSQFVSLDASPTVQLGKTTLVGREISSVQQEFFGNIPYADPPLAGLRFRAPVLKSSLDPGPFNATEYGPACLQIATGLTLNEMSEDCLTINVLRPAGTSSDSKLPVMFWTYGGGFVGGQASTSNASLIVAQSVARGTPIIFINFNYRLGPLGFPRGQEAGGQGAVNLGIKDQIAALQWVQMNIESFGGDKNKVTMFGQSAGSVMTSVLFLNPSIVCNLARGAIFESGYQGTAPLFSPARDETEWETFVSGVPSCSDIATSGSTFGCLAQANTTEILQGFALVSAVSTTLTPWPPVLDGPGGLIPDFPSALFQSGQFARLPFIAGTVLDEGTTFVPQTINSTEEILESILSLFSPSSSPTTLEESAETVLQLYPDIPALGSPFGTGNSTFGLSSQFKRAAAIIGDSDFQAQRRLWIETAANAGVKTFGYLFTEPQPTPSALGVFHASELVYVFGKPGNTSPASEELSRIMTDYWVSFVTSLTPNDGLGVARPEWAQYTPQNKTLMQLNDANLTMIPDDYRADQITFLNSDPAIWRR